MYLNLLPVMLIRELPVIKGLSGKLVVFFFLSLAVTVLGFLSQLAIPLVFGTPETIWILIALIFMAICRPRW